MNGGGRADKTECHIYKRVEGESRSGAVQRDDKREMFVFRDPLLAWKTLMNRSLVSGHAMVTKS